MRTFQAPTLTALHDRVCDGLIYATADELDMVTTVDVQIHNTVSQADSLDWEFDLKSMWLTKSRWSMMVRQYLDPEELVAWLTRSVERVGLKGRGISVLRTKSVAPRGGPAQGNKETRRWGSCMLALSYKALPQPQLTLYSRTSYLGYIGALDLSVAYVAGKHLARSLGCSVEDLRFVWFNEALQWHNFKSLAYLLNHRDHERQAAYRRLMLKKLKKLSAAEVDSLERSPALRLSRNWIQKVVQEDREGKTYGDMTYNTYRRIRRRYHTEVLGYERAQEFEGWSHHKTGPSAGEQKEHFAAYKPLPSVSVESCDFSCISVRLDGSFGEPYSGSEDEMDEED